MTKARMYMFDDDGGLLLLRGIPGQGYVFVQQRCPVGMGTVCGTWCPRLKVEFSNLHSEFNRLRLCDGVRYSEFEEVPDEQ